MLNNPFWTCSLDLLKLSTITKVWLFHATSQQNDYCIHCSPVILSESHGHSNWYQTVQFGGVYHIAKQETNHFTTIKMQATVLIFKQIT